MKSFSFCVVVALAMLVLSSTSVNAEWRRRSHCGSHVAKCNPQPVVTPTTCCNQVAVSQPACSGCNVVQNNVSHAQHPVVHHMANVVHHSVGVVENAVQAVVHLPKAVVQHTCNGKDCQQNNGSFQIFRKSVVY